ncbi:MAG: glycosyltransferase family 2 protein [Deltaproteobacteria bacterium]|jgi:glycosyltransferase involved in cell wall biosynthesis|nr:glycosyltransferase family 2 protein [Deltaproteobacteria bacterium]
MSVAILMCTYNGKSYIIDQLNSILGQSLDNWHLYISDDNSTDQTLDLIKSWTIDNNLSNKVTIYSGPGLGFAKNFLTLTANKSIRADYYFWADQDDIWLPDKLARAIEVMNGAPADLPIIYGGRTILVDKDNTELGLSPLLNKFEPCFNNALVQTAAGANTMAFNNRARDLIILGQDFDIPSHDWWSYLIVSGNGGKIIYDTLPTLRYRQHGANIVGSNKDILAKLKRFFLLFFGQHKEKIDRNLIALLGNVDYLSDDSKLLLSKFIALKKSSNPFKKLFLFRSLNIYRQSALQTLAFNIAFAIGNI